MSNLTCQLSTSLSAQPEFCEICSPRDLRMFIDLVHFRVKMGKMRGKKSKRGVQQGENRGEILIMSGKNNSYLSYHFDRFLIFVSLNIFSCAENFLKISEFLPPTFFVRINGKLQKKITKIYLPKAEKIFKFEFFVAIATVNLIR